MKNKPRCRYGIYFYALRYAITSGFKGRFMGNAINKSAPTPYIRKRRPENEKYNP